jgi:hypothetical protein
VFCLGDNVDLHNIAAVSSSILIVHGDSIEFDPVKFLGDRIYSC